MDDPRFGCFLLLLFAMWALATLAVLVWRALNPEPFG